jgi:dipeptidyl aminopeptidase/acylaminoacyl peptidase
MSMIHDPQLYKCAASYAGVMDLPLMYDAASIQSNKTIRDELADIIGDPTDKNSQLETYSPVFLADKIVHPVLLAQGLEDQRVDPEHAYRMKLMLDILKKPYEFYTYQAEGHGFYENKDAVDFYTHLLDFLDRNIGSRTQAAVVSGSTSK